MSFRPIECPECHALMRSKYEIRSTDNGATRCKWLQWCPVCGTRLRVVRDKGLSNCVKGAEVVNDGEQ